MTIQPEAFVILVHIGLLLVYAIFILFRISYLRTEHIIPLCLIPIFGPILALVIEFMNLTRKQGTGKPGLETLGLDDDILWTTLTNVQEKGDLVPLEEAVLINEVKIRRRSMLETLYADPLKYLSVLNTAKYNEDIETSHYATTTISKAQKDYQLSIQKYAVELERQPNDLVVLDAYVDALGKYIQSGLLEENLLRNLRIVYSQVLDKKLARERKDKQTLVEKLRNAVELHDFTCAYDVGRLLKEYWPEDEQTWIEILRVCVEGKDGTALKRTIEEIQNRKIIWTDHGRELVNLWVKGGVQ